MRRQLRFAAVVAVVLAGYAALIQAFHLLNEASDQAVYGGIAIVLGLMFFIPVIVRTIWRKL